MIKRIILVIALLVSAFCSQVYAADRVKLGFMAAMSGPLALLGNEMRRGLELALAELGNKLGGLPVTVSFADSKGSPASGVQEASKLIYNDRVDIVTGVATTSVFNAVAKTFAKAGIPVIGTLGGPSRFAGKDCNANIFVVSFENESMDEGLGKYLTEKGFKNVYFIGLDFQPGWEHIAGARRTYKGKVAGQTFTPLNQLDFSAELAEIQAAKPDAVYTFLVGAPGIAFVKQYAQAGLQSQAPLFGIAGFSDPLTFRAQGDAALGITIGTVWNPELDNAADKKFVAEFRAKYKRMPTMFAALQYDAVKLIDSAIRSVHGNIENKNALRAALRKADFQSVRGPFRFGNNQFPIENIYVERVVKDPQGGMKLALIATASKDWEDRFHKECPMK